MMLYLAHVSNTLPCLIVVAQEGKMAPDKLSLFFHDLVIDCLLCFPLVIVCVGYQCIHAVFHVKSLAESSLHTSAKLGTLIMQLTVGLVEDYTI